MMRTFTNEIGIRLEALLRNPIGRVFCRVDIQSSPAVLRSLATVLQLLDQGLYTTLKTLLYPVISILFDLDFRRHERCSFTKGT